MSADTAPCHPASRTFPDRDWGNARPSCPGPSHLSQASIYLRVTDLEQVRHARVDAVGEVELRKAPLPVELELLRTSPSTGGHWKWRGASMMRSLPENERVGGVEGDPPVVAPRGGPAEETNAQGHEDQGQR